MRARVVDAPARRRLVLEHQPRGQRAGSRYAWDLLEGHLRKVHRLRHPNPCLWPPNSQNSSRAVISCNGLARLELGFESVYYGANGFDRVMPRDFKDLMVGK